MNGARRQPWWLLAIPLSYFAHLAEEWWGGDGFSRWTARSLGVSVSEMRFIIVNSVAAPIMFVGTLAAVRRHRFLWIAVAFAALVLLNGVLHATTSLATATYSPGTITGVVLYLPLGLAALRYGHAEMSAGAFWRAIVLGLGLHALVTVVAFWR